MPVVNLAGPEGDFGRGVQLPPRELVVTAPAGVEPKTFTSLLCQPSARVNACPLGPTPPALPLRSGQLGLVPTVSSFLLRHEHEAIGGFRAQPAMLDGRDIRARAEKQVTIKRREHHRQTKRAKMADACLKL